MNSTGGIGTTSTGLKINTDVNTLGIGTTGTLENELYVKLNTTGGIGTSTTGLTIKDKGVDTEKLLFDTTFFQPVSTSTKSLSLKPLAITAAQLATDAITTTKLTNLCVTGAKIANGTITATQLADNAVTTTKLTNLCGTGAKIANGTITATQLADNAVTTTKLTNLCVTGAKIANGTITATQLADNAVTTTKLTNLCVTGAKIADDAVTTTKLADNAVTTTKLTNLCVTGAKIADGSITGAKIADGSITGAKLENESVDKSKLKLFTKDAVLPLPSKNLSGLYEKSATDHQTGLCVNTDNENIIINDDNKIVLNFKKKSATNVNVSGLHYSLSATGYERGLELDIDTSIFKLDDATGKLGLQTGGVTAYKIDYSDITFIASGSKLRWKTPLFTITSGQSTSLSYIPTTHRFTLLTNDAKLTTTTNTANAAQNTANTAQNTANAAQSTADAAQTAATTAQNTANAAQTTAGAAEAHNLKQDGAIATLAVATLGIAAGLVGQELIDAIQDNKNNDLKAEAPLFKNGQKNGFII